MVMKLLKFQPPLVLLILASHKLDLLYIDSIHCNRIEDQLGIERINVEDLINMLARSGLSYCGLGSLTLPN